MLSVLVMFQKCATCSVMCEIWGCHGVREERLLRKEEGGGGVLFESRPWYEKRKIGRVLSQIGIGGFVRPKLYHGCRSYDFS